MNNRRFIGTVYEFIVTSKIPRSLNFHVNIIFVENCEDKTQTHNNWKITMIYINIIGLTNYNLVSTLTKMEWWYYYYYCYSEDFVIKQCENTEL